MVSWIVNDLSLDGQYPAPADFIKDLIDLLKERRKCENFGHSISCSNKVQYRKVSGQKTMRETVNEMEKRELRFLALRWLTKGPFWIPPPESEGIVYLHREDVTDQGLGEAARRTWLGEDARSISFPGLSDFEIPILNVDCLRENGNGEEVVSVPNVWNLNNLCEGSQPPKTWASMVNDASERFSGLDIACDQIIEEMSRYPYNTGARNNLMTVLNLLDKLALARQEHGNGSSNVTDWLMTHTTGKKAKFSSEHNDTGVFLFKDPKTGNNIECPWHGKVKSPNQYRVHYEWPMPADQKKIKVLFIGQKLTKK